MNEMKPIDPPSFESLVAALESDKYLRLAALDRAIHIARGDDFAVVPAMAERMYAFLSGDAAPKQEPASSSESAAAPRSRRKKPEPSAEASPQVSTSAPSTPAEPAASAASTPASAPAATGDIFGAPSAAAVGPTAPTASAETQAKPSSKEKELTVDNARDALVEVQTALQSRPAAGAILKKYSKDETIGGVKKEDYAALIKECQDAVAAARK